MIAGDDAFSSTGRGRGRGSIRGAAPGRRHGRIGQLAGSRWAILAGITLLWVAALGLLAACAVVLLWPRPTLAQVAAMPPLPPNWPAELHLGMMSGPDQATEMRATAAFGFRYQYLAGGVNTGQGWATWEPRGEFVTSYAQDTHQNEMMAVFTYYMLTQSAPGRGSGPNEPEAVMTNVRNAATMRAYFQDLRLFFERAAMMRDQTIVLHVEPDLWGFLHQQAASDDARQAAILVGSTGVLEIADLPDDLSGFARAIVRLRDRTAPNVLLGYHVSSWGTGTDLFVSNATDGTVDEVARREAAFYRSLGADFDLAFAEFSDRDAAFKQHVYRDKGRSWWDADDFTRHVRFLARFVERTGKRIVLWQIPLGNTRMRAMDNTWNHFQDTRVEWLLDDPGREHLSQYVRAGVIALLFGRGADGATNAGDSAGDGITDPPPINGNDRPSLSADDDGGYFRERAAAYYREGPLILP